MKKKLVTDTVPVHLLETGNTFKLGGQRHVVTFVGGHEDYNGNHDGRYDVTCYPEKAQFDALSVITVPGNTTFKVRRVVVEKDGQRFSLGQYRRFKANEKRLKENEKRRKSIVKANKKRRKELKQTSRRVGGPYAIQRAFEGLNIR